MNTTGRQNTYVGAYATSEMAAGDLTNVTALGYAASVNTSNTIVLGNGSIQNLQCKVALTTTSDKTLKEKIEPVHLSLEFLSALKPVQYHRIGNESLGLEMGLIAQDVESNLNASGISSYGLISTDKTTGIKSLRYNDLFAPIISSLQAINKKVDAISIIQSQYNEVLRKTDNAQQENHNQSFQFVNSDHILNTK